MKSNRQLEKRWVEGCSDERTPRHWALPQNWGSDGENSKQGQIHHCKKQENLDNNGEASDRPRGQRTDTVPHSKFQSTHCPFIYILPLRVHPKGNQSWVFIGRTDAEAETPILWPPHAKCWLIGKDRDAGKDWRWEEKGTTGWDGWMASPTQWTWIWVDGGQGGLECCHPWGCKQWDVTERLNWLWCHILVKVFLGDISLSLPLLWSNMQRKGETEWEKKRNRVCERKDCSEQQGTRKYWYSIPHN